MKTYVPASTRVQRCSGIETHWDATVAAMPEKRWGAEVHPTLQACGQARENGRRLKPDIPIGAVFKNDLKSKASWNFPWFPKNPHIASRCNY